MAQPPKPQYAYPAAHQPGHLLRRVLTGLLCALLALQPMLAQAAPALAQPATLTAREGQVSLLAKTDTDYVQTQRREADLLWWNEQDSGQVRETVRPVEIEAGGGLRIDAGRGVVIEYHKTGDLRASLGQLAEAPGLRWIASLQADPRVDWRGVEAAFREWDYEQSGLSEAGAALVALVTAVATGGMDFSAFLSSGALSGVKATAFNAGMQALTVNASVALVNNQGDLAATLKQLASADILRALASAMVTAGLTAHLEQAAGLGGELTGMAQYMERGLIRATVRAGVGTALQGGSLDEHLIRALQWQAIDTIGEVAAREIGAAAGAGRIDQATRYLAHAALGCGLGAAAGGSCEAGAIGGVAGEAVGDWLRADMEARLSQGTVRGEDLQRWVDQGVSLARLAGGVGAWLATGEAGALRGGGDTAANAARHNAMQLLPIVWLMLEGTDKALTAKDAYDLAEAVKADDEERAAKLATEIGIGLITDGLPGNNIIRKALGIFGGKGARVAGNIDGPLQKIFEIKRTKGNFNIGSLKADEAAELGRSFVGPDAVNIVKNGKVIGFRTPDGLRQFRFPAKKLRGQAKGKTQANIEEFFINAEGDKIRIRNAHIDIIQ